MNDLLDIMAMGMISNDNYHGAYMSSAICGNALAYGNAAFISKRFDALARIYFFLPCG